MSLTPDPLHALLTNPNNLHLPAKALLSGPTLHQTNQPTVNPPAVQPDSPAEHTPTPSSSSWSPASLQALQSKLNPPPRPTTSTSSVIDDQQWGTISERTLTPEQARDARLLENRAHLDGKRFYKSSGTGRKRGQLPTRVHFGTVQVGPHEFFSARIPRRQRRARFIDEVLADDNVVSGTRKRFTKSVRAGRVTRRVVYPSAKTQKRR